MGQGKILKTKKWIILACHNLTHLLKFNLKRNIHLEILGIQLLIDLEECDEVILDDLNKIRELLIYAAKKGGAKIIGDTFHKFDPQGVTGIVSIAESHISIHTWPEFSYAAIDVFSCGPSFKEQISAEILINGLKCNNPRITRIERGLM